MKQIQSEGQSNERNKKMPKPQQSTGLMRKMPWELGAVPSGYWQNKENRIAAVKWLVEKIGKKPGDILLIDFSDNGLAGLLAGYYRGSPYFALVDAGFVHEGSEMRRMPNVLKSDDIVEKTADVLKKYINLVRPKDKNH